MWVYGITSMHSNAKRKSVVPLHPLRFNRQVRIPNPFQPPMAHAIPVDISQARSGEPVRQSSAPIRAVAAPVRLVIAAADGYRLGAHLWRSAADSGVRPIVIINAATSVRCRYYFRFAEYLFQHGFDVITFDYRGIGDSRPARMRGFRGSWCDWGALDFQAVLAYTHAHFPQQPVHVVGHSFGGCAAGLAASSHGIRRLVTVGAQYAYWRDYAPAHRVQMLARWHVFMPLVAALCGYFPGQRLGWLEDTPNGVVKDWCFSTRRFEDRASARKLQAKRGQLPFDAVSAHMLAISVTDDPFGTVSATERLLSYFRRCDRTHLRLPPAAIGEDAIGHFGFFHNRFAASLWPVALAWLQGAALPDWAQNHIVSLQTGASATPAVSNPSSDPPI